MSMTTRRTRKIFLVRARKRTRRAETTTRKRQIKISTFFTIFAVEPIISLRALRFVYTAARGNPNQSKRNDVTQVEIGKLLTIARAVWRFVQRGKVFFIRLACHPCRFWIPKQAQSSRTKLSRKRRRRKRRMVRTTNQWFIFDVPFDVLVI